MTAPKLKVHRSTVKCAEPGCENFVTDDPKAWKDRYCLPCRREYMRRTKGYRLH